MIAIDRVRCQADALACAFGAAHRRVGKLRSKSRIAKEQLVGHVHVTNPVADEIVARLSRTHEVTLGYGPDARSWDSVAPTVEAALVRAETIDGDRIRSAPRLRIVARHGVGTDNVDLAAAAACGVVVTTTPGANARAVAEHTFALMLEVARRTSVAAARVRAGVWSEGKTDLVGRELHGRTLLLVGGGGIPRLVAPIAAAFGMTVLVADPYLDADAAAGFGATLVELDAGLRAADVVSLHVPLTDETEHLLDAARLDLLRPAAIVVNTSRGGIVDERALLERLRDGRLAGAGLDVIEAERVDMNDPLPHSATDLAAPGLVVTPHIAGQTEESLRQVGLLAVESIEAALAGETPPRAVRLPAMRAGV
jgi:D-3-phosphoglycerate dehydrogenase / 2-oxoglutarate reductase